MVFAKEPTDNCFQTPACPRIAVVGLGRMCGSCLDTRREGSAGRGQGERLCLTGPLWCSWIGTVQQHPSVEDGDAAGFLQAGASTSPTPDRSKYRLAVELHPMSLLQVENTPKWSHMRHRHLRWEPRSASARAARELCSPPRVGQRGTGGTRPAQDKLQVQSMPIVFITV